MFLAGGFLGGSGMVTEHDSAAYWLSADVGIARYDVSSSMMQLVIKNNKNFKVTVTNITSNGIGSMNVSGGGTITLGPGQSAAVNVSGVGCSGGAYSIPLRINYVDMQYGTPYSLDGAMPLVGTCMTAQKCSSDSDCGAKTSACSSYCNGNQACSYSIGSSTCNMTCSGGLCQDCTPPCGSASCTSCGTSSYCSSGSCTACSTGYANCNNHATCDVNTNTDSNNCGSCGHVCGTGQTCSGGTCTTVANCNSNCTFGSSTICNASCSSSCSGWQSICDGLTQGVIQCSGNSQFPCCNGAATSCGISSYCVASLGCTACSNGTANCNNHTICDVNTTTDVNNCGSCGHVCGTGQNCSGGTCTTGANCNSNCTFGGSGICNASCSGFNGCTNFRSACGNQSLNAQVCSDSTGGTSGAINYQTSCCSGTIASCGQTQYCSSGSCTTCSSGYANCNQNSADACEINLKTDVNNCGSCGHACGAGQACQSGSCVLVCNSNCTFGSLGICNASCSSYCSNFLAVCDTFSKGASRCSNSSGGTSGALNYYTSCCNGAITSCPAGTTCTQTTSTTTSCVSACLSNCIWSTDNMCHSTCSGVNGCTNAKPACDNQPLNAQVCSDSTGGTSGTLNSYVSCCNGAINNCPSGNTCTQTTPTTVSCIPAVLFSTSATITITDPTGAVVVSNAPMTCNFNSFATASTDASTACGPDSSSTANQTVFACTYPFTKDCSKSGAWTATIQFTHTSADNAYDSVVAPAGDLDSPPPSGQVTGDCTAPAICATDPLCRTGSNEVFTQTLYNCP